MRLSLQRLRQGVWVAVLLAAAPAYAAQPAGGAAAAWQPAKGPLMSKFARDVKPDQPLPEYPRPQMVRKEWRNLNGLWDYAIKPKDEKRPQSFDGKILVPFPVESAL